MEAPRAAALRSCIRPLVGQLPSKVLPGTDNGNKFGAQESSRLSSTLVTKDEVGERTGFFPKSTSLDAEDRGGLSEVQVPLNRSTVRKLISDLTGSELKTKTPRRSPQGSALGTVDLNQRHRLAEQFGALVARPPAEVMALARAIDMQRGNGSALRRALAPNHIKVRSVTPFKGDVF